jgi:hypothetical protein
MATLGASNMNMNMNMNMGAALPLPSVAPAQVRFNTADYRKLVQNPPQWLLAVNPLPAFPVDWDPDLRSYIYLNEFVLGNPGWVAQLTAVANGVPLPTANLELQLAAVLDAAPDREDRFAEIIHQHDAEGAISYFLGMLMIDPARHPKTYLLIRVARRIGELVTMVLKGSYMMQRPSQVCAAVVPMIDPPVTPSFPAGHALEAHLIGRCLKEAWAVGLGRQSRRDLLDYLAHRIGENRVIAGVHYPSDIAAGEAVADACFPLMAPGILFTQLLQDAQGES